MISAPNIPEIGDPVVFKEYPGRHVPEQEGRVIGRCCHRGTWRFDVKDHGGTRFDNLIEVRLDPFRASARAKRALAAENLAQPMTAREVARQREGMKGAKA